MGRSQVSSESTLQSVGLVHTCLIRDLPFKADIVMYIKMGYAVWLFTCS